MHIASADPEEKPVVDPRYLSDGRDVLVASAIALAVQAVARTRPLADRLEGGGRVVQEGFPAELGRGDVAGFVRESYGSTHHPLGTCAMGPRGRNAGGSNGNGNSSDGEGSGDEGNERLGAGVVDSRFRVHGTANVRVVDASVAPLMVRGNLASLVYALAERGADFIKGDQRRWREL